MTVTAEQFSLYPADQRISIIKNIYTAAGAQISEFKQYSDILEKLYQREVLAVRLLDGAAVFCTATGTVLGAVALGPHLLEFQYLPIVDLFLDLFGVVLVGLATIFSLSRLLRKQSATRSHLAALKLELEKACSLARKDMDAMPGEAALETNPTLHADVFVLIQQTRERLEAARQDIAPKLYSVSEKIFVG